AKPINHLELFFAGYPRFSYDPPRPCKVEYRTARSEREAACAGYQRAMVLSFDANYRTDVNDLGSLLSLAKVLQINPIPERVRACQEAIRAAHVNLVDLVDWGTSEGRSPPPTIFGTPNGLRVYTKTTRKVFPLKTPSSSFCCGLFFEQLDVASTG
ncbi:hypothetical protein B0H14DRAFT_2363875, partial [Mycena olivaceomarginata]